MDKLDTLWTEKYRPEDFSSFKGQSHVVDKVKMMVEHKNIINMLFAGPAGTGKTTLALIIAKKMFGEAWRHNILELNASDDRGIDVVRNTIKDFARTKALGTDLPKIVLLDECDALTREAQQALRRTMEQFSSTSRFILSCNYSSKLIDPIQSRCAIFRFRPLEAKDITSILHTVVKKEALEIEEKALQDIIVVSEGDVRRATNILQSCAVMNKKITEELIYDVVSAARPDEMKAVLEMALQQDFIQARDKLLDVMTKRGLSGLDIIKQIQKDVWHLNISDEDKLRLVEKCGEVEFHMVEGSDEFVQLESLLAAFVLARRK